MSRTTSLIMRMSQVLTGLTAEPGERIAVRTIVGALSDRSFAILMVLLGLPNCLPMLPPIPALCAIVLMVIAVQMIAGRTVPWLPASVMRRSVKRDELVRAVARALPFVTRLERWSQPRWRIVDRRTGAVLSGCMLIAMALGMLSAPPFIGQVPFGLAVCLVGLGHVERDGLLVLAGVLAGLIGATLSASFLYAVFKAASAVI